MGVHMRHVAFTTVIYSINARKITVSIIVSLYDMFVLYIGPVHPYMPRVNALPTSTADSIEANVVRLGDIIPTM